MVDSTERGLPSLSDLWQWLHVCGLHPMQDRTRSVIWCCVYCSVTTCMWECSCECVCVWHMVAGAPSHWRVTAPGLLWCQCVSAGVGSVWMCECGFSVRSLLGKGASGVFFGGRGEAGCLFLHMCECLHAMVCLCECMCTLSVTACWIVWMLLYLPARACCYASKPT